MGGSRRGRIDPKLRQAILETERVLVVERVTPGALQGDDYPLEYYEDAFPKLLACLDRRPKPAMAEAA
jgi:hypothetical protein